MSQAGPPLYMRSIIVQKLAIRHILIKRVDIHMHWESVSRSKGTHILLLCFNRFAEIQHRSQIVQILWDSSLVAVDLDKC